MGPAQVSYISVMHIHLLSCLLFRVFIEFFMAQTAQLQLESRNCLKCSVLITVQLLQNNIVLQQQR